MTIVSPMGQLRPVFADKNGKRLSGGKVYTYEPGTLTPKATYTDALNLIPNTNPIDLDKYGEADIFLNGDYRIRVVDRHGTLIDDYDNLMAWATKRYLDSALSGFASGANNFYPTLADANADIANIAVNQVVNIGELENGGLWYKESTESTTLTKTPYDAFELSKQYSNQKQVVQEQYINDLFAAQTQNVENIINQQGVSLQQLDDYYNYLMQRLAQIAVDKGWEASFVVDASGKTQQEINDFQSIKNKDIVSILDYDRSIPTDGTSDAATKIQAVIQAIEAQPIRQTYYLFPASQSQQYLLSSPVTFRKSGIELRSLAAPTYQRNKLNEEPYPLVNKIGGAFLCDNVDAAFKFDNTLAYDISGWTIKNVHVHANKPTSPAWKVASAFKFITGHNGPDRAITFDGVGSRYMNIGVHITNANTYMGASLNIQNSCYLASNNYAIYCEQKVEGIRIVGNQLEQNYVGGIYLRGAGGIIISDNMLEGQPNPITLDGISISTGSKMEVSRNYFEGNTGQLISFKDTSYGKARLTIKDNQIAQPLAPASNVDLVRVYNNQYSYPYTIENYEDYPVTFMDDARLTDGSSIYPAKIKYHLQRGFAANGAGAIVAVRDFTKFSLTHGYTDCVYEGTTSVVETQIGRCRAIVGSGYMRANASFAANDIVTVNLLVNMNHSDAQLDNGSVQLNVIDGSGNGVTNTAYTSQSFASGLVMLTFTFKVLAAKTNLRFYFIANTNVQMLSANFKNHGAMTGDWVKVYPQFPKLNSLSASFSFSETAIAAGKSFVTTRTLTGLTVSDAIKATTDISNNAISINARIISANTIGFVFTNTSDAAITVPAWTAVVSEIT